MRLTRFFAALLNPVEQRLVTRSIVIGVIVWATVHTLKYATNWTFETIQLWVEGTGNLLWVLVPLLLGALVMAAFSRYGVTMLNYRTSDGHIHKLVDVRGDGMERAIALYYSSEPALEQTMMGDEGVNVRWKLPTWSLVLRKSLATLVTIGTGGSGGLEASVTLIGESLSAGLFKPRRAPLGKIRHSPLAQKLWRWWSSSNPDELQAAQLAGIAAAISAYLGAPFTAAFFAVEVMYRRRPVLEKLIFALISALVAYFLNLVVGGQQRAFEPAFMPRPPITAGYYLLLALLAFSVAMTGILLERLRLAVVNFYQNANFNDWQRHLTGALLTGVIALLIVALTGEKLDLILGTGDRMVEAALDGQITLQIALAALVGKMLATTFTIGSGGSAGFLVPSLFFGTMTATILSRLFGYPPILLIIPAMTASLVSIVNIPLAATFFVVEIFGSAYLLPALVVLVLTLIFTHDTSIYRTQREEYQGRQLIPGYSTRRVMVPPAWDGQTIIGLQIRARYGLNVIGLLEKHPLDGHSPAEPVLNPRVDRPLKTGDSLILLGQDPALDAFVESVAGLTSMGDWQ
ncbi:MAG: chloride channel protein [Caldilineaceae bacterium]